MHRYDAALEMGLVNTSDEVCAGETELEKDARSAQQIGVQSHCRDSGALPATRGPHVRGRHDGRARDDDDDVHRSQPMPRKSVRELHEELDRVMAEIEQDGMSNKQAKKLERRRRGIMAALESSDEGVSRD